MHDSKEVGKWLGQLSKARWSEAMIWLDNQMKHESTDESSWNDHWNNNLRFCKVMEAYLTLCYSIKHGNVALLQGAMREVCIILQAPSANKPKYAREMLRQLHIMDTTASDPILQQAFLANALVNPQGRKDSFYEVDLLLEHQNGEFKRFRSDRGSSLQETDQMFKLHALSVDALAKVRRVMNKVVIGRERKGRHPIKDSSFDILSLSDQLYRSRSTVPEGPRQGHIYFSENPMPNLIAEGIGNLAAAVSLFNKSVGKNNVPSSQSTEETESGTSFDHPVDLDADSINPVVDELFLEARGASSMTSDLAGILL